MFLIGVMLKIKTSPKKEPAMVSWSSTEEIGKLFSEKIPSADIPTLPLKLGETILSSTVQEWFVTISLFDFFTWMLAVWNISPQNQNSHCIMLDKPVYHASDQGLNNIWKMSAACVLQLRWLKKHSFVSKCSTWIRSAFYKKLYLYMHRNILFFIRLMMLIAVAPSVLSVTFKDWQRKYLSTCKRRWLLVAARRWKGFHNNCTVHVGFKTLRC